MPDVSKVKVLPYKREMIINKVKSHIEFLRVNAEKLDIFEGNLLPYIDRIMAMSLSPQYYNAIKHRILPINILQRYVEKVSVAYASGGPKRIGESELDKKFLGYYSKKLDINTSGMVADTYSAMFKGFAWEPYIKENGQPSLRELPFDRFIVISDSKINPEDETIFVKIMGDPNDLNGDCLLFTYTDTEFDAFYMNMNTAYQYIQENDGENQIGCIPFVYGKRQKNRLIPIQDTDILAFTKSIPVMLSDAAGAQMFQCFCILYGIDLNFENIQMAPNAFWNFKSDGSTDKDPKIGTLNPTADTEKVIKFVITAFVLWLETKGIRVGSIGNVDGGNVANGISKIIDEMDVNKLVNKSMDWFEKDEMELWNVKLPKIHRYWIETGLLDLANEEDVPGFNDRPNIQITFERPEPMVSRSSEIADAKSELELGTVEFEDVVKKLHPEYSPDKVKRLIDSHNAKNNEGGDNADSGNNNDSEKPNTGTTGSDS